MKYTHFRTPRSLNDAFGPYAKLDTEEPESARRGIFWSFVLMAVVGLMFAWRG